MNVATMAAAQPQAEPRPPVEGFSGWWDASDAGSVETASGGKVAAWRDKSGGARHMTQLTPALRVNSGSWTRNGRNVLWSHSGAAYMGAPLAGALTAQPWTAFVAAGHYRNTNQQTTWTGYDGFGAEWGRVYRTSGGAIAVYANGGFSTIPWETGRTRVVSTIFDGASSALAVDGRTRATGAVAVGGSSSGFSTFGFVNSEHWEGWIGELLIYPRRLTASEVGRVEGYLTRKWGLA
jgi:hypothetical protein